MPQVVSTFWTSPLKQVGISYGARVLQNPCRSNQSRLVPLKVPTCHLLSPHLLLVCSRDSFSITFTFAHFLHANEPLDVHVPYSNVFHLNLIAWQLAARRNNHTKRWRYPLLTQILFNQFRTYTDLYAQRVQDCASLGAWTSGCVVRLFRRR